MAYKKHQATKQIPQLPTSQPSQPKVSNEVTLDTKVPIPIDTGYIGHAYLANEQYIKFLPPYNNYAQMLLEAKMLSVTHNACVETKANYCAGIGFQDKDGKELDKRILDWFKSVNLKNHSLTAVNELAYNSHFTFGNTPIELVRFKTSAANKYFFAYAHDLQEWRLHAPNEDTDICEFAIQSKWFRNGRYNGYSFSKSLYSSAKVLPIFSPYKTEKQNWKKFPDGTERTLIWFRKETLGYPYYGIPSAVSGMISQLLEYNGARYNMDNFENNMVIGGVLAIQGNLKEDEANRIAKQVIKTHTGSGKRGRVAVVASEQGITGSDWHDFDTTKDGSYIEAKEVWRGDIILANEWDAVLAGLINPSTLGKGADFITTLIEYKERTVIQPAQLKMMQAVWDHVFPMVQQWLGLPFDKYELQFKNNIDISGLSSVDITPAVTKNEVRLAKRLPKLQGAAGEELMKASNTQKQDKGKSKQKEAGNG